LYDGNTVELIFLIPRHMIIQTLNPVKEQGRSTFWIPSLHGNIYPTGYEVAEEKYWPNLGL
jgi:hypothetical protein